jgi:hypothetical protein
MAPASLSAESSWVRTIWRGDSGWTAAQGAVRAVVIDDRSRLIYLGSLDGGINLLNAPYPAAKPTAPDPSPNQGGHRFWLGPQRRWKWPPLREWEYSPAASAKADGTVLTVSQMHLDPSYPAIVREYAWEGNRLRCTARWQDDGRPYFGIHVVPVDAPLTVAARLERWDEVPAGAVAAQMVGPEPALEFPHPSVSVDGDTATVSSGIKTLKLGFAPQALTITRPYGWTLSVEPGPYEGVALGSPDRGYLSQVWVGSARDRLAELEQLSPYLKGDARGRCASTIYIVATPPPS